MPALDPAPLDAHPDALVEEIRHGRIRVAEDHEAECELGFVREDVDGEEIEAQMTARCVSAFTRERRRVFRSGSVERLM